VLTFPPGGGPFARTTGPTAKLHSSMVALRVGAFDAERLWAFLFPPPRARKDTRVLDNQTALHLGVLAAQATFALESAGRFPDGLEGSIDPLTDLFDARYFARTLEHEIRRQSPTPGGGDAAAGPRHPSLELDGYPAIRDLHGGLVAERLLVEAARIVVRAVREVDLVSRTGPHRFEILLLGTDRGGAERTSDRLRTALVGHRFLAREGLDLPLAVSIGVSAHPEDGMAAEDLRGVAERRRSE